MFSFCIESVSFSFWIQSETASPRSLAVRHGQLTKPNQRSVSALCMPGPENLVQDTFTHAHVHARTRRHTSLVQVLPVNPRPQQRVTCACSGLLPSGGSAVPGAGLRFQETLSGRAGQPFPPVANGDVAPSLCGRYDSCLRPESAAPDDFLQQSAPPPSPACLSAPAARSCPALPRGQTVQAGLRALQPRLFRETTSQRLPSLSLQDRIRSHSYASPCRRRGGCCCEQPG